MLLMTAETESMSASLRHDAEFGYVVNVKAHERPHLVFYGQFDTLDEAVIAMPIGSEDDYVPYTTKDQRV